MRGQETVDAIGERLSRTKHFGKSGRTIASDPVNSTFVEIRRFNHRGLDRLSMPLCEEFISDKKNAFIRAPKGRLLNQIASPLVKSLAP